MLCVCIDGLFSGDRLWTARKTGIWGFARVRMIRAAARGCAAIVCNTILRASSFRGAVFRRVQKRPMTGVLRRLPRRGTYSRQRWLELRQFCFFCPLRADLCHTFRHAFDRPRPVCGVLISRMDALMSYYVRNRNLIQKGNHDETLSIDIRHTCCQ